jgi:hypothetical protein
MMKKILTIIIAAFLIYGCEDEYLNLSPISEISSENFYQTESDFNSAINATYNSLQSLNEINWKMQEVRSDNAFAHREEAGWDIDNFEVSTTDVNIAEFYQLSYNGILRANVILDKIDNVEFSQSKKDQIIGQAKFIRGLIYFDLVRSFGDVPLINNVVTLSESYEIERAPLATVYASIISDFADAVNLLPEVYESSADMGRATKGAANGMLAKVNLTSGNLPEARTALEEVIGSKEYSLLPSYSDIWNISNQNSSEIVFAIQYSDGMGNGNMFNYIFAPLTQGADINPGTGLGMTRPTADLIRAYEENDTRMSATLSPYEINPNTNDTTNLAYFRKFIANQQVQDGGQDWPILRYADILLMYSEVLNEMDDLSGAIEQLNLVRSRAFSGLSDYLYDLDMVTNKSEMRDIILNERRLEFACENHRWFDLLRFDKAEEFLQTEIRREDWKTGIDLITYSTSMKEFERLFPIPFEEIEKHNGTLSQNTGY